MSHSRFQNVALAGLTCCTGPVEESWRDLADLCGGDDARLQRLRELTGVETRHVAPSGVTTLDIGQAAAVRLLERTGVAPDSIDTLLFVTQTPDSWQPCNANRLHGLLDLPHGVAALDINQGCSGWVYGLQLAHALIASAAARRVLLLAGDTTTQLLHPRDRSTRLLFGDACSATLIEYSEDAGDSWFGLHSDGRGHEAIEVPAGGFRLPRSAATACEQTDVDGNVRTPEHLYMNGLDVLNFTLREEPAAIRELLQRAGESPEQIDGFALHQANRFILEHLVQRLGLDPKKVPAGTLRRYGNQSSASIPAVLCHDFGPSLRKRRLKLVCSGFGVGLSWGNCLLEAGPLRCAEIFQYT